jgi:hypothetical protein
MATAQVHELEWSGCAHTGEVPLLQVRNGNQMLTDCPAESLNESSGKTFGRVQHPETAERVVKSVGTCATEVDR